MAAKAKEVYLSLCQINIQDNFLSDLESPLISDQSSYEWFEDENKLNFKPV